MTDDIKAIKKQSREYKKYLKELSEAVTRALNALDMEMRQPSSIERGKRVGQICNSLNYSNDMARHFGLGESLKKKAINESEKK